MIRRILTRVTNRIYEMPVLVLMPHSRCNCRCVMCDIWKANDEKRELSVETLREHVANFSRLHVREVVLSGGEALMHSNLWSFCALLRKHGMRVVLLTTGLLIDRNAENLLRHTDEIIVSLDGGPEVHNRIRNIPNAFERLAEGVRKIKQMRQSFRVTARCVVQRRNYFDFYETVRSANSIGLDSISFLAADVSTNAFNRPEVWDRERSREVALTTEETASFEKILTQSFSDLKADYDSGFIAENPEKMMRIAKYYRAINNEGDFPRPVCDAPWVSAVVESNGDVLPCFFHKPYGNIYEDDFRAIVNSESAVAFRKKLNMNTDPICQKCVCSLKLGLKRVG